LIFPHSCNLPGLQPGSKLVSFYCDIVAYAFELFRAVLCGVLSVIEFPFCPPQAEFLLDLSVQLHPHFLSDLRHPQPGVQGASMRVLTLVNDIHIAPAQPAMNLHLYWHAEQKYPKLTQFGQLCGYGFQK
jgi:hypothetical protein